jgi:hypothetical protein
LIKNMLEQRLTDYLDLGLVYPFCNTISAEKYFRPCAERIADLFPGHSSETTDLIEKIIKEELGI